LIQEARETYTNTLVLDAGNSLLYDTAPATTTYGQTSIEAMNLLGYDAMSLGLNDLTFLTQEQLEARIQEAQFAVISANAYSLATGELITDPYVILEKDGYSIGIIGLTEPGERDEMAASDPEEALEKWLPKVVKQADIVILLSHNGVDTDAALGEEFEDIDLIVSGRNRVMDAPMMLSTGAALIHADYASSGTAGERVGIAQLIFSSQGELADISWKKVLLDEDVPVDEEMSLWVDQILADTGS